MREVERAHRSLDIARLRARLGTLLERREDPRNQLIFLVQCLESLETDPFNRTLLELTTRTVATLSAAETQHFPASGELASVLEELDDIFRWLRRRRPVERFLPFAPLALGVLTIALLSTVWATEVVQIRRLREEFRRLAEFSGAATAIGEREHIVPVFYATDRARTSYQPLAYGADREQTGALHLGRIDVRVPEAHKMGHTERPGVLTLYIELEDRHFVIREAKEQTYRGFYADLNRQIVDSAKHEVLVFIHGFNVPFQDAVFRTAQIAADLQFDGGVVLYSWPSLGDVGMYATDYSNNEWTFQHLQFFLEDVVRQTGTSRIHLIAHSMGNRALTFALDRITAAARVPPKRFSQIILAAPDIDTAVFESMAAAFRRNADRITLSRFVARPSIGGVGSVSGRSWDLSTCRRYIRNDGQRRRHRHGGRVCCGHFIAGALLLRRLPFNLERHS